MKRYFIIIILFTCLIIGCKKESPTNILSEKVSIINKARYCFGGIEKVQLNSKNRNLLHQFLTTIQNPISGVGLNKKKNYGFLDLVNENGKTELVILFTSDSGNFIIYKKKYYRDTRIIEFAKKVLKIFSRDISKKDCK